MSSCHRILEDKTIERNKEGKVLSEKIIFREKFEILSNSNRVVHVMYLNQESVEVKHFFNIYGRYWLAVVKNQLIKKSSIVVKSLESTVQGQHSEVGQEPANTTWELLCKSLLRDTSFEGMKRSW